MESRLNSCNYCTVLKAHRKDGFVTLDVDVIGDPLRPKEAVLTLASSANVKAPRSVSCRHCSVTAGFGVHTWISLQFQIPASAFAVYDQVGFAYNPGWSKAVVDKLFAYGEEPKNSGFGGGSCSSALGQNSTPDLPPVQEDWGEGVRVSGLRSPPDHGGRAELRSPPVFRSATHDRIFGGEGGGASSSSSSRPPPGIGGRRRSFRDRSGETDDEQRAEEKIDDYLPKRTRTSGGAVSAPPSPRPILEPWDAPMEPPPPNRASFRMEQRLEIVGTRYDKCENTNCTDHTGRYVNVKVLSYTITLYYPCEPPTPSEELYQTKKMYGYYFFSLRLDRSISQPIPSAAPPTRTPSPFSSSGSAALETSAHDVTSWSDFPAPTPPSSSHSSKPSLFRRAIPDSLG